MWIAYKEIRGKSSKDTQCGLRKPRPPTTTFADIVEKVDVFFMLLGRSFGVLLLWKKITFRRHLRTERQPIRFFHAFSKTNVCKCLSHSLKVSKVIEKKNLKVFSLEIQFAYR